MKGVDVDKPKLQDGVIVPKRVAELLFRHMEAASMICSAHHEASETSKGAVAAAFIEIYELLLEDD